VLVVRAALAANTLAELIALAKAQPGKLTYASSGAGGAIHLASELFKREAGVDIVHVPYRGGGPAVMGLLTGDVDIFINDASTTVENIRAGKLKALAVAAATRSPLLPQVPTFAEQGFPAVVSSSWFGLAAPANTPVDVIGALAAAMPAVFASANYQARLQKLGLEQFSLSPEQSAAFIEAEFDKWAEVAKSAGIQAD
jgi:tripartite-type tricarboxylate transporter receptor subunit TctC